MLKENERILDGDEAWALYEKLKADNLILFECIVGSQAYGTALPTSDVDKKFIYIEPVENILNQTYSLQLNLNKDYTGYEIGRYLQLLRTQNPNIHEMLYAPEETIIYESEFWKYLKNKRSAFLTKEIGATFGGYADSQIKKARGQNKMITQVTVSDEYKKRKTPLDFCYVPSHQGTIPLTKWLEEHFLKQEFCGLVKLDHTREGYALFYDWMGHLNTFKMHTPSKAEDLTDEFMDWYGTYMTYNYIPSLTGPNTIINRMKEAEAKDVRMKKNVIRFKGIIQKENSNSISLTSIPNKNLKPLITMFYNEDSYVRHCKEHLKIKNWEENRNEERYQNNLSHGALYDSKNMMHCHRLLDMCIETLETGTLNVRRPNVEQLLSIRRGEYSFHQLLVDADNKMARIKDAMLTTKLPEKLDEKLISNFLLEIRKKYYNLM